MGLVIIIGSVFLFLEKRLIRENPTRIVKINETSILAEIADTEEERSKGLSGRESLAEDEGLLFVFEEPGLYGFWMKDMNFAIDIIWIDESRHVIGIERGVAPETFPNTFHSPGPVKYVLEVPSGRAGLLEPGKDMLQF